jgi:hypothetical protein
LANAQVHVGVVSQFDSAKSYIASTFLCSNKTQTGGRKRTLKVICFVSSISSFFTSA